MNQIAAITPVETFKIKPPTDFGVNPETPFQSILSNVIMIVFIVATLAVLFMLIFGALQWILSGGEKEKVSQARGRITNALIGFAILALAFLIVTVVGQLLGIKILGTDFVIPSLNSTQ